MRVFKTMPIIAMLLRKNRYIIILTVFVAILAIVVGCTKPDRSKEATQLFKLYQKLTK